MNYKSNKNLETYQVKKKREILSDIFLKLKDKNH